MPPSPVRSAPLARRASRSAAGVLAIVLLLALALVGCASRATPSPSRTADLVIRGGTIITLDPLRPRAEAVAVVGSRIVAVGSAAELAPLVGAGTQVIDLAGGTLTPGWVDAHAHLYELGLSFETVALKGLTSAAACADAVRAAMATRADGEWLVGDGWDQNLWTPAEMPTRAILDAVSRERPIVLYRVDGHAAWLNGRALAAAGIDAKTVAPPGGAILRDARGEPTGVLIDRAMDLVARVQPEVPPAARRRQILAASARAVASGMTGVHEMGVDEATIAVYRALAAEGLLPLRVYALLRGAGGGIAALERLRPDHDADGTAMFTLRAVKLFADGALGSRGAHLLAPYSDAPDTTGLVLATPAELASGARLAAERGFQLAVHAIGDAANREVLDAFAPYAGRDLRFRVEHAQVITPEDLPRFAALGVIASMQPTHATSDMRWAVARLGETRAQLAYAWRSLVDSGAHVAFGSDFPVEEVGPLLGMYAAVTRQDATGWPGGGWFPAQRLTIDEALAAYTREPAYAAFVEGRRGVIAPGAVADFTAVDRALAPDASLLEVRVSSTIVGGRVVFSSAHP